MQELLEEIEEKELARLEKLSLAELQIEWQEWFGAEYNPQSVKNELIVDLLQDFMRYRQEEGYEELLEVLNRY